MTTEHHFRAIFFLFVINHIYSFNVYPEYTPSKRIHISWNNFVITCTNGVSPIWVLLKQLLLHSHNEIRCRINGILLKRGSYLRFEALFAINELKNSIGSDSNDLSEFIMVLRLSALPRFLGICNPQECWPGACAVSCRFVFLPATFLWHWFFINGHSDYLPAEIMDLPVFVSLVLQGGTSYTLWHDILLNHNHRCWHSISTCREKMGNYADVNLTKKFMEICFYFWYFQKISRIPKSWGKCVATLSHFCIFPNVSQSSKLSGNFNI